MAEIFWGRWEDYEKQSIGDREYAKVGGRLYTRHAVDYFFPSGSGLSIQKNATSRIHTPGLTVGRSIPPAFVEEAILHGTPHPQRSKQGVPRICYRYGDLEVVTESNDMMVVTISYRH